ncbi:ribonuclease E inhibitor RraB [Roseimaritima sediminicola]|uniref:ribonuclease E inhibitor RraB n=1 Tax=Roseimaritima sediminicola TaxID=2662066 RepID=UPI0012984722|nr:ribonuclease E inhibitor RraB [Roseimaritima sediminicola]
MNDEPDLSFDIDALFAHLTGDLDQDLAEEQDWSFSLRSDDSAALQKVAAEMEDDFLVHLQENVQEVEADGSTSDGDPLLMLVRRGVLDADEVKQIAAGLQSLAAERGLRYEGVECYDPIDEEELFGWMELEDAAWRLRHMSDIGLEDEAEMPWAFLVEAPSLEASEQLAAALGEAGFEDRDDFDEPDEDGSYGSCVFVEGRNDEGELRTTAEKISQIAGPQGCQLLGIQFYTREDVAFVFGDDEEDEDV